MIQVLVATNRKGSRSAQLAQIIEKKFEANKTPAEVMLLEDVDWGGFNHQEYGADAIPETLKAKIQKIDEADGIYVVCPEYNGSFPGVMKAFIDYWRYPQSFEARPVCFTGLGGMFGGLRPVEHLQQVFGYRNAFIFPERIFLQNVWGVLQEGKITDEKIDRLFDLQIFRFSKFVSALKSSELHANTRN